MKHKLVKSNMEKEQRFTDLVLDQKASIYSVCYMFATNRAEAEDLFQEVFIRLWTGFDTFKEASSARTWVYRISLNTCLNDKKKQARRVETVPLDLTVDLYQDTDDPKVEQIRQLYDRVSQLEAADRALVLMWLEGMSYEEIGIILGISTKNVSVRLVRIKEKLIKLLK